MSQEINDDMRTAIYNSYMQDPDFALDTSKSQEEIQKEALRLTEERLRQMDNTNRALSMSITKQFVDWVSKSLPFGKTEKAPFQYNPGLKLEEADDDYLMQLYDACEVSAKDWEKKGYRDVSTMYKRKMYDIDRERDRRAALERNIFKPGGLN